MSDTYDDLANRTGIQPGPTRRASLDGRDKPGPTPKAVKPSMLDSEESRELHGNLLGHYQREMERQSENRMEMARDEDFYDGEAWTQEEKAVLAARGQLATNFNVISTTLNWVIGTERRGRTDYKILPRRKEGSVHAERKTDLMKYLSDANRSPFAVSKAFQSAIKTGVGWLESGWQYDDDGEPVYDRAESWRNMLWDSMAAEDDLSDARFIFRSKWMDVDIAARQFKARREVINQASSQVYDYGGVLDDFGDDAMDSAESSALTSGTSRSVMGGDRRRVRMIEAWFRRPALSRVMAGGDFAGELFDEYSDGHMADVDQGRSHIVERVKMRTYTGIMTTAGLVHLSESPYRHNRFPFTPIWAYRRARDGMPYGMIRGIRDLQVHINKAAMKAQYILSTNKTIMEEGAVDDLDEYAEEVARPDAIIVIKQGKRLDMNVDRDLAPAHLDLMSRMIAMVQQQSGVTDESLGRTTNATSGKAILARQDQGSLATAALFDNLKYAMQVHGEKMLTLCEQFISEEKSFRITNKRGVATFVDINKGLPENFITLTKADYIISEDDWNATTRQAGVQALMELIAQVAPGAPQILMIMLDLIVEMMDIPSRDEVVKRIRQVTGMKDPDADPDAPPTPEEAARAQAQAAEQEMAQRGAQAQVSKVEAEAAAAQARADKAQVEAKKVIASLASQNIETQKAAFEAAMQVLSAPQVAAVADALLMASGYSAVAAQQAAEADTKGAEAAQAEAQMADAQAKSEMAQMAAQNGMAVEGQPIPQPPQPGQPPGDPAMPV